MRRECIEKLQEEITEQRMLINRMKNLNAHNENVQERIEQNNEKLNICRIKKVNNYRGAHKKL